MNIELTRYGSIPGKGTFGEIWVDGMRFFTVEREWLNNEPYVSCVPSGEYKLVPHDSRKYPETWALVNEDQGVFHYGDPKAIRTAILIHVANKQKELAGCIGIGRIIGENWSVASSRHAMEYVLSLLAHESEHTLNIKWRQNV